ncbi:MAG: OmpA family protein [Deltaproteobacteria bacterium]|nr:OmpA family protein [Deltaproteobacteria bacterium]
MKRTYTYLTLFFFTVIPLLSTLAFAGEVNFDDKKPTSAGEVIKALKPDAPSGMKLRGINYNPTPPKPKMVSVSLQFEKNSYDLTEGTKKNLDAVGQALNSNELKSLKFVLEGHTDASGPAAYNLSLSKKRAQSVKQYLINVHKVDPNKLKIIGKGEQDLFDPAHPFTAKNRRVRIITIQ